MLLDWEKLDEKNLGKVAEFSESQILTYLCTSDYQ